MNYIIRPSINTESEEAVAELRDVSEAHLLQIETFYSGATLSDKPIFTLNSGDFVLPDGREVPFQNYQARVEYMFDQDGDHYWGTSDGGVLNVTSLAAMFREAVEDARARTK